MDSCMDIVHEKWMYIAARDREREEGCMWMTTKVLLCYICIPKNAVCLSLSRTYSLVVVPPELSFFWMA